MTTGNKLWAIGRAVERAFQDGGAFAIYQHRDGGDDWAVRATEATVPRNFVRRFTAYGNDGHVKVLIA